MYQGLLHAHSGFRYLALLSLIILLIVSLRGWILKRKFSNYHKLISGFVISIIYIQSVIGIWLYFSSSKVLFDSEMIKSSLLRFFTLEHPLMMMIALILITVGHLKTKAYSNFHTHKKIFWYHFIAMVLIIVGIPWPFRELGSQWF